MTRYVVVLQSPRAVRASIVGPFRTFAAAERKSDQIRKRVTALNVDAAVFVERLSSGSESVADVLEAWSE